MVGRVGDDDVVGGDARRQQRRSVRFGERLAADFAAETPQHRLCVELEFDELVVAGIGDEEGVTLPAGARGRKQNRRRREAQRRRLWSPRLVREIAAAQAATRVVLGHQAVE